MLSVPILAMEIMQEKAATFGTEINWSKTKNQEVSTQHYRSVVYVAGNKVEVADCFKYLGVQISNDGNSEQEVRRRVAMTRDCFQAVQNNIWYSSIRLETRIRLLNVYVLLYRAETWSFTSVLEKKLDACQQWCLRRLLRISHLQHVTSTEALRRTNQTQLSTVLCNRRLQLFGHVARSDAWTDHSRALHAVILGLTESLKVSSRPTQTVMDANHEKDVSALSIGLHKV